VGDHLASDLLHASPMFSPPLVKVSHLGGDKLYLPPLRELVTEDTTEEKTTHITFAAVLVYFVLCALHYP
jgi:hypothetical protein